MRVEVNVSGDNDIKNTVTSYVYRELRSLNYVELVSNKPEWEINIIAMVAQNISGEKRGVILSTVITHHVENLILSNMLKPEYKDDDMSDMLLDAGYTDHFLYTGATDDLQKLCTDIVATFDTNVEDYRKNLRKMIESTTWFKDAVKRLQRAK